MYPRAGSRVHGECTYDTHAREQVENVACKAGDVSRLRARLTRPSTRHDDVASQGVKAAELEALEAELAAAQEKERASQAAMEAQLVAEEAARHEEQAAALEEMLSGGTEGDGERKADADSDGWDSLYYHGDTPPAPPLPAPRPPIHAVEAARGGNRSSAQPSGGLRTSYYYDDDPSCAGRQTPDARRRPEAAMHGNDIVMTAVARAADLPCRRRRRGGGDHSAAAARAHRKRRGDGPNTGLGCGALAAMICSAGAGLA